MDSSRRVVFGVRDDCRLASAGWGDWGEWSVRAGWWRDRESGEERSVQADFELAERRDERGREVIAQMQGRGFDDLCLRQREMDGVVGVQCRAERWCRVRRGRRGRGCCQRFRRRRGCLVRLCRWEAALSRTSPRDGVDWLGGWSCRWRLLRGRRRGVGDWGTWAASVTPPTSSTAKRTSGTMLVASLRVGVAAFDFVNSRRVCSKPRRASLTIRPRLVRGLSASRVSPHPSQVSARE